MKLRIQPNKGSTLVVTITVVASLLVLLGVAVEYSTQISRNTQRTRKTQLAMEIADGHLETLYTSWRNILRTTVVTYGLNTGGVNYDALPTNHFFTTVWNPGPAPTSYVSTGGPVPPTIPTPASTNFPTEANYQLTQYRIQAVDPMINLDASENALYESATSKNGGSLAAMPKDVQPPGAYGPSAGPTYPGTPQVYYPYSYYYLAAADVTVPALSGTVTAKVRRVFEKKFDLPWTYAIFFVDDLEIEPSSTFIVNGPVHTNGSLYITTSNFTVASPTYTASNYFPTSGRVEYGSDYVNGYHPKDTRYPGSDFTTPTFAKSDPALTLSDCPPSQVAAYLPFGWSLALNGGNAGTGSGNDDSYHEIIEPPTNYPIPAATSTDPLANVRYYNQAGIKVLIDKNNTVRVFRPNPSYPLDASKIVELTSASSGTDKNIWQLFVGGGYPTGSSTACVTTNLALYDARETQNVRIAEVDVSKITYAVTHNDLGTFNGVIYIADTTPPFDMSRNRVTVPGSAVSVPDPNYSSASPTASPFDPSAAPQARLGSTNGTSGGTLVSTRERAIRLVNGWSMPTTNITSSWSTVGGGLTFVSMNPVYIKGNYNTAAAASPAPTPPSNVTSTSSPVAGSYVRQPAAVIADAINVLSGNWTDANSTSSISGGYNVSSPRAATSTTINAALVSGIVPTGTAGYSGGAEGFIRLQEDWRTQNFVYYGSISQFFTSLQGNTPGSATGNWYKSPATTRWFYDYATFADAPPPGNMQIAAYLQQQRWYQVY